MYGLRPGALLVFVPKYHVKAGSRGAVAGLQARRVFGAGAAVGAGAPRWPSCPGITSRHAALR